ncbi:hypothetical protein [Aliivibrio finisterrensis]|uniref:hypothetical protein n=1 Tax=Aliivibrio finisterrensis TaxID=511998 RepID=UPI00142EFE08|nr:hypothetical protein [Aliivibrio finisterrensis]
MVLIWRIRLYQYHWYSIQHLKLAVISIAPIGHTRDGNEVAAGARCANADI